MYIMKIIYSAIISIMIISLITSSHAVYVVDGQILILRSQFLEENPINDVTIWNHAGLLQVQLNENHSTQIRYGNNNEYIFFSVNLNNIPNNSVAGIIIFFDTDGDGQLTSPEDAKGIKRVEGQFKETDYFFDGTNWKEDPTGNSILDSKSSFENSVLSWEFQMQLQSEDVLYDGLQVPNPSNFFIALNFQYLVEANNQTMLINFPTSPTNVSGYIDMRLAGPEDKDLPQFAPPSTQIEFTNGPIRDGDNVYDDIRAVGSQTLTLLMITTLIIIIGIKRSRLN
jgi:hypothetical protein